MPELLLLLGPPPDDPLPFPLPLPLPLLVEAATAARWTAEFQSSSSGMLAQVTRRDEEVVWATDKAGEGAGGGAEAATLAAGGAAGVLVLALVLLAWEDRLKGEGFFDPMEEEVGE